MNNERTPRTPDFSIHRTIDTDNSITVSIRCCEYLLLREDNEPLMDTEVELFQLCEPILAAGVVAADVKAGIDERLDYGLLDGLVQGMWQMSEPATEDDLRQRDMDDGDFTVEDTAANCEACGKICEYDTDVCLCKECESNGDMSLPALSARESRQTLKLRGKTYIHQLPASVESKATLQDLTTFSVPDTIRATVDECHNRSILIMQTIGLDPAALGIQHYTTEMMQSLIAYHVESVWRTNHALYKLRYDLTNHNTIAVFVGLTVVESA